MTMETLYKMIDGARVEMTEAEAAAFRASAPVAPVPQTVSAAQARIALGRAGLLGAVEAFIAAAADAELKIWWEYETVFRRESPRIAAIGAALGLTAAQIDALFRDAAAVT